MFFVFFSSLVKTFLAKADFSSLLLKLSLSVFHTFSLFLHDLILMSLIYLFLI